MVETVNEEVLALPVQQREETELRNTLEEVEEEKEGEANAVQDEIASNPSDDIPAENAKDAVVYQILQLKLCQWFSFSGYISACAQLYK